jgi:hypothetical protein
MLSAVHKTVGSVGKKECLQSPGTLLKVRAFARKYLRNNPLRLVLNAMVSGSVYRHGVIRID